MSRADFIEAGAFICVVALYVGIAVAFLIEGLEVAAVIGTIPSFAYLAAIRFTDRKAPRITDPTKEWFV